MAVLKLTSIGTSLGVVIPKDMLARMNVRKGDTLHVIETADGGYRLLPYDPDFAKKLETADDIISRYRDTLGVLAK